MNSFLRTSIYAAAAATLLGCSGGDSAESSTENSAEGIQLTSDGGSEDRGRVACTVNNSKIFQADIDRLYKNMIDSNMQPDPSTEGATREEQLKNMALKLLEDQALIKEAAAKQGIAVSEAEVDARIAQVKMSTGGDEQWQSFLDSQGLTEAIVRRDIRDNMTTQQFFAQVLDQNPEISEQEMRSFYEESDTYGPSPEVHARHILKNLSPQADDATAAAVLAQVVAIKDRLDKGEDFGEMARTESEGPSGPQGGDLGWFKPGDMVGPFDSAAFAMKPGEISDPVRTQFGYHLIELVDRREAPARPFEAAQPEIQARLINQKRQDQAEALLENLRKEAEIKYQ